MIKKTVIKSGIVGIIGKQLTQEDVTCPECISFKEPRIDIIDDKLECKCYDCQCRFSIENTEKKI